MLLLPFLLQAAVPGSEVTVRAPLPATPQVAATMLVEPVAMLIATFDGEPDGGTDEVRDGFVERSEIDAGITRTFATADPGGTGRIRYLAYSDWALRWLGDRAALPSPYEIDRDGDNVITLVEMQDHFSRLFARYDRDGDRKISHAELLTFRARPIDDKGPTGGGPPKGKEGNAPSRRPRR